MSTIAMRTKASVIPLQYISEALLAKNSTVKSASIAARFWICQQCRSKSTYRESPFQKQTSKYGTADAFTRWKNTYDVSRSFSSSQHESEESVIRKGSEIHELPSKQEFRRSKASKQLSHMMDNIQTNVFVAGQRLNDLTGYSAIEALKNEIQVQEESVQTTRDILRDAKQKYTQAINQRSQSQREVNELLQRKNSWSAQDLERFTSLYRSDHANEQAEAEAQAAVTIAENVAEESAAKLNANILARYHEEQIWSDKIRRMSTWGTWGLMGMNVLLFLIFQIGVEPWRRRRLVKGFEEKVVKALEKETALQRNVATAAAVEAAPVPTIHLDDASNDIQTSLILQDPAESRTSVASEEISEAESPSDLPDGRTWHNSWPHILQSHVSGMLQLFSSQQIKLRQVDITTKFIEGALSSAVAISLLAAIFRGR